MQKINVILLLGLSLSLSIGGFSSADPSPVATHAAPHIQFFTRLSSGRLSPISGATLSDPIIVSVTGAKAKSNCSVAVSQPLGKSSQNSQATFLTDSAGSIRTDIATPLNGSYKKADADGLFWSMSTSPADPSLAANSYTFKVNCDGLQPTQALLPFTFGHGVRAVALNDTGLVGLLFLPAAELGPRPAIIAFSGSEGGALTGELKAQYLADHGFVGLGIAYFGAPGVPQDLTNIPLEYFQKAIQYLQSRPEVDPKKIAVLGVSRGGELALLLGATFPQITAVIAQVPSPVLFGGNSSVTNDPVPAWTFKGKPLPAIETAAYLTPKTLPDGSIVQVNRPYFQNALKDQEAVLKAFVPIENTNGPILMFGAEDDQVWPSCDLISMAMQRLNQKHHAYHDQAICYPNAGHGLGSMPNFSTMQVAMYDPPLNATLLLGGTPDGNAAGIRDSWNRILAFLDQTFD